MKIKTLNSIYPEELIKEISTEYNFDMTTVTGRSQFFSMCWDKWSENEVIFPGPPNGLSGSMYQLPASRFNSNQPDNIQRKIRDIANKHDLREFWDFIIKGNHVRFRKQDDALYFRLAL